MSAPDRDPDAEPVPVSEAAPGLHPPDAAADGPTPAATFEGDGADGDALPHRDTPSITEAEQEVADEGDARPAGPTGDSPEATLHAEAAPGPVRANPTRPHAPGHLPHPFRAAWGTDFTPRGCTRPLLGAPLHLTSR